VKTTVQINPELSAQKTIRTNLGHSSISRTNFPTFLRSTLIWGQQYVLSCPFMPGTQTFCQTPSAPKPSLSVLDQQLERTMLVQESLQNIVKATGPDDSPSFKVLPLPDAASSLLSEVVNWETVGSAGGIKKWNI
jgi:hypothetical protein